MDNETFTIVASLVTGVLTFISTIAVTVLQNKKNRDELNADHEKVQFEQDKFEQQVETTLWQRANEQLLRLDKLEKDIERERRARLELEAELAEERTKRRNLEARIAKLINENAKLSGTVEGLSKDNKRLEDENLSLRKRIQELERRMGTGPLEKKD